jgi:hypothetical protein
MHRNLGEPCRSQKEAFTEAEEVRRKYGGMVVGPTHSRGVAGVMPVAGFRPTRRGWQDGVEG